MLEIAHTCPNSTGQLKARRALRALKVLVKLQALVRGHIVVRKQTVDTGPATPKKFEHAISSKITKHDQSPMLLKMQRSSSKSIARVIIHQDKAYSGWIGLDREMDEGSWDRKWPHGLASDQCSHSFSTSKDSTAHQTIKAWYYNKGELRVDYDAPGHSCTTMAYSADGTRLFSCGTSKEGESYIVEWNESEGAVKRTYHGLGKRSVGVVQFDTTKNRFLAAGDEFVIKFWDMDNVNLLTTTDAEGGLPVNTGGFMIELECLCIDMIEELINRGQQVDAVHFTFEVGLEGKFPPVPLLKAFLNDAKKAADSILEDPNNSDRAAHLAARKEQSALRAVIKCVQEYKLEAEFPSKNLKKRLDQLEKSKTEKKKPAAVPANKRTRVNSGGPMPPAKAGRSTNAYVSSFPAAPHIRSPPTNPYAYSPEAALPLAGSYQVAPVNYSPYGGHGNVAPTYQQAYYR
ncbi:hypothetical protein TEA_021126 [Camellia sinensis var. sinensis]|uniref:FRIGIDA-like protein n=1 Tax=Camellia sinensis var. sinensis TaxID=542762 RepID=A0A4S4DRH5_CAMSN|nr:hypothetical protein TEA_021126 [Camellia sinensis var. sinensis]